MTKEYIRTARPTDFARIADAGAASLMDDPLMTYFGCTTPVSRTRVHCTARKKEREKALTQLYIVDHFIRNP